MAAEHSGIGMGCGNRCSAVTDTVPESPVRQMRYIYNHPLIIHLFDHIYPELSQPLFHNSRISAVRTANAVCIIPSQSHQPDSSVIQFSEPFHSAIEHTAFFHCKYTVKDFGLIRFRPQLSLNHFRFNGYFKPFILFPLCPSDHGKYIPVRLIPDHFFICVLCVQSVPGSIDKTGKKLRARPSPQKPFQVCAQIISLQFLSLSDYFT